MDLPSLAHVFLLLFLIVSAVAAVMSKDLLVAVIIYSAYSFTIALSYLFLRSADVAMTEAAVGAGVTTILFVAALSKTSRKEQKE